MTEQLSGPGASDSAAYRLKLLNEMRDCAQEGYHLEIQRLSWLQSRAQIAFAVLGVGLTLVASRLDALCDTSKPGCGGLLHWIAVVLVAIGGLLWLYAFWLVTSTVIAPKRNDREGPPDPQDLYDQLYYDNEEALLASVALAYSRSANINSEVTDRKTRRISRAFSVMVLGMVLVLGGASTYGVARFRSTLVPDLRLEAAGLKLTLSDPSPGSGNRALAVGGVGGNGLAVELSTPDTQFRFDTGSERDWGARGSTPLSRPADATEGRSEMTSEDGERPTTPPQDEPAAQPDSRPAPPPPAKPIRLRPLNEGTEPRDSSNTEQKQ
jgi:hypothetical protein